MMTRKATLQSPWSSSCWEPAAVAVAASSASDRAELTRSSSCSPSRTARAESGTATLTPLGDRTKVVLDLREQVGHAGRAAAAGPHPQGLVRETRPDAGLRAERRQGRHVDEHRLTRGSTDLEQGRGCDQCPRVGRQHRAVRRVRGDQRRGRRGLRPARATTRSPTTRKSGRAFAREGSSVRQGTVVITQRDQRS